jgi:hypothetical protein
LPILPFMFGTLANFHSFPGAFCIMRSPLSFPPALLNHIFCHPYEVRCANLYLVVSDFLNSHCLCVLHLTPP